MDNKSITNNILNTIELFKLPKEVKKELLKVPYGFGHSASELGKVVYYRTYSRITSKGKQENWYDTTVRVIEGVMSIRKWWYSTHELYWDEIKMTKLATDMAISMIKMEWLPPGRGLWAMGTNYVYERGSMSLYNCAFTHIDDIVEDTCWLMNALMNGCGVGFSIPSDYTPILKKPTTTCTYYTIPDSKEGWINSVGLLIGSYVNGSSYVRFRYHMIRPYGAPIKGFGGTASGPDPLKILHSRLRKIMDDYIINPIPTKLIADIENAVGVCIVAGNVRRCLPWYYSVKMDTGEWKKIGNIIPGDHVTILGKSYEVKNVFDEGVQEVYNIKTPNGNHTSTANHKWLVYDHSNNTIKEVMTKNLNKGKYSFLKSKMDTQYMDECELIPIESIEYTRTEQVHDIEIETIHIFNARNDITRLESISHNSAEICLGSPTDDVFTNLKNYEKYSDRQDIGWMSNNTCILSKGSHFILIPKIAKLLLENGEPGIVNMINIQNYGRLRLGEICKDNADGTNPCGEIPLANKELCNLAEVFPSKCTSRKDYLKALTYATFYASTVSLYPTTSKATNRIIAKNRRIGVSLSGISDWFDTYGYAKCVKWLREGYDAVKECNRINNEEAGVPSAIRVSTVKPSGTVSILTGVSPGMHFPVYSYAIRRVIFDKSHSVVPLLLKAEVPHEPLIDYVQPNKTKGRIIMKQYSDSPLCGQYVPVENSTSLVFSFPIHQGKSRPAKEVSAWEQFAMLAMLQREWSDNSVSCTIYFDKEKEGPQIAQMLSQFAPIIKSVSMLPHSTGTYLQMPYEEITKEKYDDLIKTLKPIQWDQYKSQDSKQELYCTNDTCVV